ncbi:MAG: flagellar basal-body rod protein FlgG [Gammaproteobacteria bacterium]|nr:MAG: flagellar basal-body rod protein FlgG [Gammaproteobacteria bacterium]
MLSLWIAKTGLDGQNTRLGVISNNLANSSTTGYKRSRAVFNDLLYQNLRQVGAQSSQSTEIPTGMYLGTGVRVVGTQKIHQQGNLLNTGNSLDMAIQGRGFLQILQPDGSISYTRDGSLQLDSTGQIVNINGFVLQPAITIPNDAVSVTIGNDGTVSVLQPASTTPTQVGTIQLADFVNPTGLEPVGDNMFRQSVASGTATTSNPGLNGFGTVIQGSLETSNVNVVEELVSMIETQRAYEMNAKAIETADQMLAYLTQTL